MEYNFHVEIKTILFSNLLLLLHQLPRNVVQDRTGKPTPVRFISPINLILCSSSWSSSWTRAQTGSWHAPNTQIIFFSSSLEQNGSDTWHSSVDVCLGWRELVQPSDDDLLSSIRWFCFFFYSRKPSQGVASLKGNPINLLLARNLVKSADFSKANLEGCPDDNPCRFQW